MAAAAAPAAEKITPAALPPAIALEKPRSEAQAQNGIVEQSALAIDPGASAAATVIPGDGMSAPSVVPGCIPAPRNLTAWWPGDGNPFDITGGHNGYRAGSFAPGKVAQAFDLNGRNWVEVPNSDAFHFGTRDFTIDLWANFRSFNLSGDQSSNILIGNDEGGGFVNKWFFSAGGGILSFHVNGPQAGTGGSGRYIVSAPWAQQQNRWWHLAVTRAGSLWTIYVDGLAVGSETNTLTVPSPNAPLTIGQAENVGYVDGLIDEVEIFNDRALSQSEIQSIYVAGIAGKCKPTRPVSFAPAIDSPSGNGPNAIATGDFNHDGRLDLVVANGGNNGFIANTVTILQGDGAGRFAVRQTLSVSGDPTGVAVGDFNSDGNLDLAVSDLSSNITVFIGVGNGTFDQRSPIFVGGGGASSVVTADFDGDGRLDLAAPLGIGRVSVLLGNGDGSFGPDRRSPVGTDPRSIAVGDFNRDGRLDLAVSNYGSHDISVLLNAGAGDFALLQTIPAEGDSNYIVTGDFDGDGRLDLAVAGAGAFVSPGGVSIFRGRTDGSFQAPPLHVGMPATSLAVADVNGDGALDLVEATSSSLAHVLVGNGDGTFGAPTGYSVGADVVAVAAGDVNNDWRPELVAANLVSSTVSVLMNTTPPPTPVITLGVSISGSGSGTVRSSPAGINCPPTCSADFPQGSAVTLTERASANSTFFFWGGFAPFGCGLTCTVTMDAAKTMTAKFNTAPLGTTPSLSCLAPSATVINCSFSESMSSDGSGDASDFSHYSLSGGLTVGGGVFTTDDARNLTLRLACTPISTPVSGCGAANKLAQGGTYTLTATNVQTAGGTFVPGPLSATFTLNDTTPPTATVTQAGASTLVLRFSEPVDSAGLTAANITWDGSPFPGGIAILSLGPNNCELIDPTCNAVVRLDFLAGSVPTGAHTLALANITDGAGNPLAGTTSFPITLSADTTPPAATLIRAADGTLNGKRVSRFQLDFSEAMAHTANGFTATQSVNTIANYTLLNPDLSPATTGGASGAGSPITINRVDAGDNGSQPDRFQLRRARLRFSALLKPNVAYVLNVSNLTDEAGNPLGPQSYTLLWPGDTTPPSVQHAIATPTRLFVDFTDDILATVDGEGSYNTHACVMTSYQAKPGSSGEAALNAWLATLGTNSTLPGAAGQFFNSQTNGAFTGGTGAVDNGFGDGCTFNQDPTREHFLNVVSTPTLSSGFANTVDTGDQLTFTFNEAVSVAANAVIRVTDSDCGSATNAGAATCSGGQTNTVADIICGTNASCTLDSPRTTLTVTMTANPTIVAAGSVSGAQYPVVITDSSGMTATTGNTSDHTTTTPAAALAPGTYTLQISGASITDDYGNVIVPNPTFATLTVAPPTALTYPLTLTLQGSGSGYVTSSPPGITCPPTCSADFPVGSAVMLTQLASATSSFSGWNQLGCSTFCAVTVDGPRSVTANYNTAPAGVAPALTSCSALNATTISCSFNVSMSTDGSADINDVSHYSIDGGVTLG
ncbi:MAG TPA: FG-GAP-like repeat-containing protein, partial [Acidimicrobiia bacterium]|nr:FG-GAP-like repeat-containing protein [Acidimicrobiia bacterium]